MRVGASSVGRASILMEREDLYAGLIELPSWSPPALPSWPRSSYRALLQASLCGGWPVMLADPEALASEVRSKPPVLLVHGDADPVLPVTSLRAARVALQQQGFEVAAYASPGLAHSIDAAGLRLGEDFLDRVLG